MRLFLLLPLFLFPATVGEAAETRDLTVVQKPRMCYFQLTSKSRNNESGTEGKDLQQTFALQDTDEVLKIYFGDDSSTRRSSTAFKEMAESGETCSVLVISGHNTGDFHANNPDRGALQLKLIEELACDPKYQNWFSNVKALYLHGSRTVNDKYLEPIKSGNKTGDITGDTEAVKDRLVGSHERPNSNSRDTIEDVSHSYAHTLDENNPLSSRYLRSFPQAHIFGFSEDAGLGEGDKDITDHISQVLKALKEDEKIADTVKNAENFAKALEKITADDCDGKNWTKGDKAFKPKTRDEENARRLGCILINNNQILNSDKFSDHEKTTAEEAIHKALKEIVKDKTLSHRLMNNIFETFLSAKKRDGEAVASMKETLQEDPYFTEALKEKIKSPIFPSLKKVDYIKLLKELNPTDSIVSESIGNIVDKVNTMGSGTTNEQVLSLLLADQLSQYELLSRAQIDVVRRAILPDRTGTKWQEDMKVRLLYRSYVAGGKAPNHDFRTELSAHKDNREFVKRATSEILRNEDLETAFKAAEALAPADGDYFSLSNSNKAFINALFVHIDNANSSKRKELIDRYLEGSKVQTNESNGLTEGKTNLQANLLRALFEMEPSVFSESFSGKTKKKYFEDLANSPDHLNEPSKELLSAINKIMNQS